jgi:neutral ceramidase
MLSAGFARLDITPTRPSYLAGYFTLKGRLSTGVRDPLYARALALHQGRRRVVLVVFDTLLVTDEVARALREALADTGADVMAVATHTHSAPGGYWEPLAARLALGPFVEGRREELVAAGVAVARAALDDLQPARWAVHTGRAPAAAVNRRDARLPADAHVWALLVEREHDSGVVCGASAHPVIVAERAYHKVSADFPGELTRQLEQRVGFAAFVNGTLAGGGTCLPPGTVEEALAAQVRPILEQVEPVFALPPRSDGRLGFVSRELVLPEDPAPRAAFDDQRWGRWLLRPLDALGRRLYSESMPKTATLQALGLGDATVLALPAEPGLDLSQALRDTARAQGFGAAFVAAHANGYLGYILRRDSYRRAPAGDTLAMATYENLLNVYGPDMGERLLVEGRRLLKDLGRARSADEGDRLATGS